jgi:phenylalanyl-tRNA synthetase beta chain
MKFSLSVLKEYLDINASLEEICSKLTFIGLEVENVEDKAKELGYFTVAKILNAKRAEGSNKLSLCEVEIADNQVIQVICGAANARTGIKVAFAPINSVIPVNKMVIKKTKIAGFESNGMLCSAQELGLGGEGEGIIEIDDKFVVGTKIIDVYHLNEQVIEINVTPNRGDCLGVYGIARDLAAAGIGKLKNLEVKKIASDHEFKNEVKILPEAKNNLILFRALKNVKNCPSPSWLKDKLEAVGINSISAIVDVTNYVMHVLNRPMHAYDALKINGVISLRYAQNQEKFTSLKNETFELNEDILIIADEQKPLAVAGVIGSDSSSCDLSTTDIILEAAYFDKTEVAKSARKLNINTDSRYRFERGVDPKTCEIGLEMATKLILEICGKENKIAVSDIKSYCLSESEVSQYYLTAIKFNFSKFSNLIGIEIQKEEIIKILTALEFTILEVNEESVKVTAPSHRHDIKDQEDLVEEVIRIYGYDKIISHPLESNLSHSSSNLNFADQVRLILASANMKEIISWSFIDSKLVPLFAEPNLSLTLANPISIELNHMRPTLLIGLLQAYKQNQLRNFNDLSLFEIGQVFESTEIAGQKLMVAGVRAGKNKEMDNYQDLRDFDIFDVKKDLLAVVEMAGIKADSLQIDSSLTTLPKYYHPHRAAAVKLGKKIVGYFGELHPMICKKFDLKNRINAFELVISYLPNCNFANMKLTAKKALKLNDLQPVIRDLAFLVNKEQPVAEIIKTIESCDKTLIQEVTIFDIYSGINIASEKKSIALRIRIQPQEKTLTSEEIDQLSAKIIEKVSGAYQAILRSE